MGDITLHGVLCMPHELWDGSEVDKMQRYDTYCQASRRIEDDGLEIERLRQWHAEIVALSAGWDEDGSTGPREPLSWESVGRAAMDYARAALTPNVEVTGAARLYRAASVWTAGLGAAPCEPD